MIKILHKMFSIPNPFIHGTSSQIFNLLKHSDFSLMDPMNMLKKYGIVPITGELDHYRNITESNNPRFGKLITIDYNTYDWNKVLCYARGEKDHDTSYGRNYSDISAQLILVGRCQQSGYFDENDLKRYKNQIADMRNLVNTLSLLLFFDKWLFPIPGASNNVVDALYTHCDQHLMEERVALTETNFFKVYEEYKSDDMTSQIDSIRCGILTRKDLPEDIQKELVELFRLPVTSVCMTGPMCVKQEVTLKNDELLPFVYSNRRTQKHERDLGLYQAGYLTGGVMKNQSGYNFIEILQKYLNGRLGDLWDSFTNFRGCLYNRLKFFNSQIDFFESIVTRTDVPQVEEFEYNFPIVFFYEPVKNDLYVHRGVEFYRDEPMKIGKDITKMATTIEGQQIIQDFFKENNINVQVYTFDEVEKYINENKDKIASTETSPFNITIHKDADEKSCCIL